MEEEDADVNEGELGRESGERLGNVTFGVGDFLTAVAAALAEASLDSGWPGFSRTRLGGAIPA